MISLSTLRTARKAIQIHPELLKARLDQTCLPRDADGILATHSAADVLIEIAETALAYQRSECTGARCSHPTHRSPCSILITQDALEAALAKVAP